VPSIASANALLVEQSHALGSLHHEKLRSVDMVKHQACIDEPRGKVTFPPLASIRKLPSLSSLNRPRT